MSLINLKWQERQQTEDSILHNTFVFAKSPVVFVIKPQLAEIFESSNQLIGWKSLLKSVSENNQLRIMRAHGSTSDGKLVTIALHNAAVENSDTSSDFFERFENAITEYGPNDEEVISRAVGSGEWLADVIVVKEQAALKILKASETNAVIVYPNDGTAWAEYSISLIRTWADDTYIEAYNLIIEHLKTRIVRDILLKSYLHPCPLDGEFGDVNEVQKFYNSQVDVADRVSYRSYGAIPITLPDTKRFAAMDNAWYLAKKPADVCLVVDVSGSMDSLDKLPRVMSGIKYFIEQFRNPYSKVALVSFADRAELLMPLTPIFSSKNDAYTIVNELQAGGNTALNDAAILAIQQLQKNSEASHLQVILLLTDGGENHSQTQLAHVLQLLESQPNIRLYGIAYGRDANIRLLENLASTTKGFVVEGTPEGIEEVYKTLATYA